MKNIDNFIQERLVINSKSKTNQYTCQPKDKDELSDIISKRMSKTDHPDLNDIDVSLITDMSSLFPGYTRRNPDISQWDVSNVRDMAYMFSRCKEFNCDISGWDVSNVENMEGMFYGCLNFDQDLENWNINKVKDMQHMFGGCYTLDNHKKIPTWYNSPGR